jgi:glutamate-1-semialdehyde 2,1-aminomutase
MGLIAEGNVVQAGTLNGNLIALSAAKAVLAKLLREGDSLYRNLHRRGRRLRSELQRILTDRGYAVCTCGEGSVFSVLFLEKQPRNYRDLLAENQQMYRDFVLALLDEGVLALPDGRWYLSAAHTDADIEATLAAAARAAG